MNMLELSKITYDEKKSFEFFLKRKDLHCPKCKSKEYYIKNRNRVMCKKCRSLYRPLKNELFSLLRISYSQWLSIIKLFELSVSCRKAATEIKVSYKTAMKAYDILRKSIFKKLTKNDSELKGELELDESYFGGKRKGNRGRGAKNKTIVFGILERNGIVHINIVKDVTAESLINETVKKVRRGSIVYTDKWKGYDSLMFCGYKHLSVDHKYKFKRGKVYINGIEGFWSFAKERLIKFHGVSKEKFIYYLKEQEWRYNNRFKNLFDILLNYC